MDADDLAEAALRHEILVRLRCKPGQYILETQPLMEFWPADKASDEISSDLHASIVLSPGRTPFQDLEFAIQKLAEIALRALSPSMNDPFSAILCVDRLCASVMRLARRPIPPSARFDKEGNLRLIAPKADYHEIVARAFEQILLAAKDHPHVQERVRYCLNRIRQEARTDELRRALA